MLRWRERLSPKRATTEPVPFPIFVIAHAVESGSVPRQLDAWRLRYETIDGAAAAGQDVAELMEAYGEQIFRPYGSGRTMTPDEVASAVGHLRVYEIMAKRGLDGACIVDGRAELLPGFPRCLQSPALQQCDWDVLLLAHRSSRRQRAGLGAAPSLWKKPIAAGHGIARPVEFPIGAAACLLRRRAAARLAGLGWPIRLPAAVLLAHSRMTGLDVRVLTPPCVAEPPPSPAGDRDEDDLQDAIKDAFYPPPVVDLMNRLCSPCRSPRAWSVYPAVAAADSRSVEEPSSLSLRLPRAPRQKSGGALAAFDSAATNLWRYLGLCRRAFVAVVAAQDGPAQRLRHTAILLGARKAPSAPGIEPPAQSPRPIPFTVYGSAKTPPRIAVVVPIMNRRQLVMAMLASVRSQTLKPQRLIVIDDGSGDGTAEAVREQFASGDFPFSTELVVRERNGGAAKARNVGLSRARDCEFVWFLDSDDFPPRNFLEKTAWALQRIPEAVAASTDRVMRYRSHSWFFSLQVLTPDPRPWFFEHGTVVGSCTLFRTQVVARLGGFDTALPTGHDTALFMRVAGSGPWLHVAGSPVMFLQRDFHPHIKYRYHDWQRRNVSILEDCLLDPGVDAAVSEQLRARVLCNRWYGAGRQLVEQGRWREAAECFRRSLAWRRRFGRGWFYLLVSHLASAVARRPGGADWPARSRFHPPGDTRSSNRT